MEYIWIIFTFRKVLFDLGDQCNLQVTKWENITWLNMNFFNDIMVRGFWSIGPFYKRSQSELFIVFEVYLSNISACYTSASCYKVLLDKCTHKWWVRVQQAPQAYNNKLKYKIIYSNLPNHMITYSNTHKHNKHTKNFQRNQNNTRKKYHNISQHNKIYLYIPLCIPICVNIY